MAAALPSDLLLDARFLRKLEALALTSKQLARGGERGERSARRAGSGVAFSTHRAYTAGDDFRFVDWKAFARTDRLYVKQFEEGRDLALHLLLDCSGSMSLRSAQHGTKLDYAKQLAAALGYIALVNLDCVSVQPYASEPLARLPPQRGHKRALVLLRFLAGLNAGGGTSLHAAAKSVRAHAVHGGRALVMTDGLDAEGLLAGVDSLRYARLEPAVLLIRDPEDAEPSLHGDVTLIDSESGRERTLTISERLLARYRTAYRARALELRSALRERQVPALELDLTVPLERTVLDLLRRGGVVR